MIFNKYKDYGDYHWCEYRRGTAYTKHVDKVVKWLGTLNTILDVGAGDGLILYKLQQNSNSVIGIDNDPYALEIAKNKKLNVINGSAYDLSILKNMRFNVIYAGDVIEHLEFPETFLSQIKSIINTEAIIYIVTPPQQKSKKLIDDYHYREYTPIELENFMKDNGFDLIGDIEVVLPLNRMYGKFRLS